MKLEKWAVIAEVVASFAIVLTLVILIFEVRENTEQSRLAAYEAVTRDFDDWRRDVLADPRNVAVFLAYPNEIPLEGTEENLRLEMLLATQWSAHERAYYARDAEIIDGERWERIRSSNCREYLLIPEFGRDRVLLRITREFGQYLEDDCG